MDTSILCSYCEFKMGWPDAYDFSRRARSASSESIGPDNFPHIGQWRVSNALADVLGLILRLAVTQPDAYAAWASLQCTAGLTTPRYWAMASAIARRFGSVEGV